MSNAATDIAGLSFEDALKRLEEIVHTLETGEASLEESIDLYAQGDALKQHCEKKLAAAQARIEKIQIGPDGRAAATVPFDAS